MMIRLEENVHEVEVANETRITCVRKTTRTKTSWSFGRIEREGERHTERKREREKRERKRERKRKGERKGEREKKERRRKREEEREKERERRKESERRPNQIKDDKQKWKKIFKQQYL